MLKFVCYLRVSTKEQGKSGAGLGAQRIALERFIAAHEGHAIAWHEEVTTGKDHDAEAARPVLAAAVAQAKREGAILLVSKLDRLSRSVLYIAGLMAQGVKFCSAQQGLDCPPFMLHIHAAVAEEERRKISERTRDALEAIKARGTTKAGKPVSLGGRRPHHDEQVRKAGAVTARQADEFVRKIKPVILRMRASGMRLQDMAEELNQQGNKTARGGKWHASTICNVLKRLADLGEL